MLPPITIAYPFRPARRSLATGRVADLFGLADAEPPHVVADALELDIRPGDLALFTGPSGSGKSSLMRVVAAHLTATDAMALALPDVPLVDALPGPIDARLSTLAACGLSEARLLLRTPSELSDGQRYRFRIALAVGRGQRAEGSENPDPGSGLPSALPSAYCPLPTVLFDEFAAYLDRPLAKVLAFNLRKLVTRAGVGALCATTHDDVVDDLQPDVWVRCRGDGRVEWERRDVVRRPISFAGELRVEDGSVADWAYFARWHYRTHHLGFVKRVFVLRHGDEPIGVCVFGSPAASLALRSRFFGLTNPRSRPALAALNEQLWLLSRVVLHPTYRGAGLAAGFVREACSRCPADWIETLTAMGAANPFFERAGFVKVGTVTHRGGRHGAYAGGRVSAEALAKSRHSAPVYYVFDNRGSRSV